jgi:anthranilate synthase component 2
VRVLVVDNYDSFTYNLVQYLGELGAEPVIWRNDAFDPGDVERLAPARIVISPGPGTPAEAGHSIEIIRRYGARIPLLGVCLGHQAISAAYGGKVVGACRLMHGKTSRVHHDGADLFRGLANPFDATRYHSLVVEGLPADLEVTAWTTDLPDRPREGRGGAVRSAAEERTIMGVRHRRHPVRGVQFHPESILTGVGKELLKNFLEENA